MGNALRSGGTAGDVALFIDWENIKRSVVDTFGRMPDLSAIKKAAMQFGRLAVARAYANWQDGQHQNDCEILYKQGIDPVFVATRKGVSTDAKEAVMTCPQCKHRWTPQANKEEFIKNSVDVRMATECIREVLTRDNLGAVVLASGDESMLHVANLVKSLGKQVVIMAVSGSVSPPLTYLADKFILYDDLVAGFSFRGKGREEQIQEALEVLAEAAREIRSDGLENTFPVLKTLMRRRIRDFEEEILGFPKFEYFVFRAEQAGLVRADVRGLQQEVYLGHETKSLTGKPLPGSKEWGWLITRLKQGPQFLNELRQEINRAKVLAGIPGAKAQELIDAAVQSGLIIPHREPRYLKSQGREILHFDLRLNELNSRVQVYLGLEMKPPTVLQSPPPAPVPQTSPEAATIQNSAAERYRTYLRQAGMRAISLSREERLEILRLLHEFLGRFQGERPYREQSEEFVAICTAINSAWSKNRILSLVELVRKTGCLIVQGSPLTSTATLADGLSVEEMVKRCDLRCLEWLVTKEPVLDPGQAAMALFDAAERVEELQGLLQELIRTHRVRQEDGKLVSTGGDLVSAGVERENTAVTTDGREE